MASICSGLSGAASKAMPMVVVGCCGFCGWVIEDEGF